MIKRIKQVRQLVSNMGWRYVRFRGMYEIKRRSGLLKALYPKSYTNYNFISLKEWRKNSPAFFFQGKKSLKPFDLDPSAKEALKKRAEDILAGKYTFFNSLKFELGREYNWTTNPETGAQYDANAHWTKLEDADPKYGDIKYVWEKSRFAYLYTLIRYDFHFDKDQGERVVDDIIDWINHNKLNCGPNYICSQEISLRVLNWTFALYYYKDHEALSEERFKLILNAIHGQLKHVRSNINFSRISVRNNHAITETLALYLSELLFPFFKESKQWSSAGKKYLEEEALYQIYEDGSFLQFSMNYQRVVIQLFTWCFYLNKKHSRMLSKKVKERVQKCLMFLYQHQELDSGYLPNYGANDGALFFKLSSNEYRDYRPQLNALYFYFNGHQLYEPGSLSEDLMWYGENPDVVAKSISQTSQSFNSGGFYVMRKNGGSFAMIRCGNHKDRPQQADNLHMDVWDEGVNILRDAGTYQYYSPPKELKYFAGTASHNTVMLEDEDQMQKGGRFIWYYWSQAVSASLEEKNDNVWFTGKIHAFKHLGKNIFHNREARYWKDKFLIEVIDTIENAPKTPVLRWHVHPDFESMGYKIECFDEDNNAIKGTKEQAWHSSHYGVKEHGEAYVFRSEGGYFKTVCTRI